MEIEEFEILVGEALDGMPEEFLRHMDNVEIIVEEWPSRDDLLEVGFEPTDRRALLGLYHGIPTTERGNHYYMVLPDRISIYKGPIENFVGPDPEAIKEQVRRTVIHEIAHYYGIDDDRLEELGWE